MRVSLKVDRVTLSRLAWAGVAMLAFVVAGFILVAPAFSYVPLLTRSGSGANPDHWDFNAFPVTFTINPATKSNIKGTRAAADVITASFATWQSAPNTAINVSRGNDTNQTNDGFDGVNLICFVCQADFSKDANTLAVTITTTSDVAGEDTKHGTRSTFPGQIMDADIIFNPSVNFTTGGTSGQDLQTIATHEIGHFFGLDHSGVVRAVMFPFAPSVETQLAYDDVAGISNIYPKNGTDVAVGKISGTVKFASGGPVFGAHVYASSTTTAQPFGGSIRKSPISSLTDANGAYTITGVPLDQYTVTAEPLDGPMTNGDIEGYASANGRSSVQTGFNTRWH